ncbi:MAG: sensor histidine kinase [Peptococcaceae bacterium]|nr:sensor histidine kinase [Peptococcaceae bacterium]
MAFGSTYGVGSEVAMYYQFALINVIYIYFVYGLSCVVMGLAVSFSYIQFSKTAFTKEIRWLGAFGITHGISEWAVMFTTMKYFMGIPATFLVREYAGEVALYLISFLFLLQFGIKVANSTLKRIGWLQYILVVIAGLSLLALGIVVFLPIGNQILWLETIEKLSRYLMGFPGTVLASIGFLLQRNELERLGIARTNGMIYGVSMSFLLYGIAAGLLVSRSSFFPANGISLQSVDVWAIAPVPILRSLGGIGIAYFTIRVIGALNQGYVQMLEAIQKKQVLSQERECISRDLHDGVIQSLYAIGLQMKEAAYLAQNSPERVKQTLEQMIDQLDDTIRDVRLFIQDLRLPRGQEGNLGQVLKSQLDHFSSLTGITVELSTPDTQVMDQLSSEQANHLYYIVQEALVNIAKHAEATQVYVDLTAHNNELSLSIIDDGKGMMETPCDIGELSGHGMGNIRSRVGMLNGRCHWESHQGFGTRLTVVVPLGKGSRRSTPAGRPRVAGTH